MFDVEHEIGLWRDFLRRRGDVAEADIAELESHLRDGCSELEASGLASDEAFLVSAKRLGNADALCREFAKSRTGLLWKQLFLEPADPEAKRRNRFELLLVIGLAIVSAVSAKLPVWLTGKFYENGESYYWTNAGLFFAPAVAAYIAWKHRPPLRLVLAAAALFVLGGMAVNLYPFPGLGQTRSLAGIHLPLLAWAAVGALYAGSLRGRSERRLDFLRISGEAAMYYALAALGGLVLMGFTQFLFETTNAKYYAMLFVNQYMAVCGAFAAPVAAFYIAEAKRSVAESIAPVLAGIFSPLFLVMLLAFVVSVLVEGRPLNFDREALIAFDVLLALVLAMALYRLSARPEGKAPGWEDALAIALMVAALAVDAIALFAMAGRLADFGATPNRAAAIGENILLAVNLIGLLIHYARFMLGKADFGETTRFQTAYLSIYAVWFAFVVFAFPPLFGFR